jgi:hypothetical protein
MVTGDYRLSDTIACYQVTEPASLSPLLQPLLLACLAVCCFAFDELLKESGGVGSAKMVAVQVYVTRLLLHNSMSYSHSNREMAMADAKIMRGMLCQPVASFPA